MATKRGIDMRDILVAMTPMTDTPQGGKLVNPGAFNLIGKVLSRKGFAEKNLDPATGAQLRYHNTRPPQGASDSAFFAMIQNATPANSSGAKRGRAMQSPTSVGGPVGVGKRYG